MRRGEIIALRSPVASRSSQDIDVKGKRDGDILFLFENPHFFLSSVGMFNSESIFSKIDFFSTKIDFLNWFFSIRFLHESIITIFSLFCKEYKFRCKIDSRINFHCDDLTSVTFTHTVFETNRRNRRVFVRRPTRLALNRLAYCVFADGDRQEAERDHRSSDAVFGARGESLTFCLACVPRSLTIECDDDAIIIACIAASAAGGQRRGEGEASHHVRAKRHYRSK